MRSVSGSFELLGDDHDETRLLIERTSGYSVPLVGRPVLAPAQRMPGDAPAYDAIVALRDVQAEHGFRLDSLPQHDDPRALVTALVEAYARRRAENAPKPSLIGPRERAEGTLIGARAIYPLRDAAALMEQLEIVLRPSPGGLWAMVQTTRFVRQAIDVVHWGHLRTASYGHAHWDPGAPRTQAPAVWPTSELALPSAALELTEMAQAEATAKARDLGVMAGSVIEQIVDLLCSVARADFPPTMPVIEMVTDGYRSTVTMAAPADSADALLRNLGMCKTAFDLRAWAKQCVWALDNRESAQAIRTARELLAGDEAAIAYAQHDVRTLTALAAVQQVKGGVALRAFRELAQRGAASHCVCEMILRQPWDDALAGHALATLSRIDPGGAVFVARLWQSQDPSLNVLVAMLNDPSVAYEMLVERAQAWFAGVPAQRRDVPLRADILRVRR
jgi:hypothetical protein